MLSQLLVAYTVELDNQFELRMSQKGFPGARLSLVVWANLLRFVPPPGISFRELLTLTGTPQSSLKLQLGCLERWWVIRLALKNENSAADSRKKTAQRRQGWGTAQKIGMESVIQLTGIGEYAGQIWPGLWREIDQRWETRLGGEAISKLRQSLEKLENQFEISLPFALPGGTLDEAREEFYPRKPVKEEKDLPLSTLLSRVLLKFAMGYDRKSRTPLVLSANLIRVLKENQATDLGELPRLTGGSSEVSDIGWRAKPFVVLESSTKGRGKSARLSQTGVRAQNGYYRFVGEIEKEWQTQFGKAEVQELRISLETLLEKGAGPNSLLTEGLVPPAGVARAGILVPALGRRDIGPAAKQRMKDLVEQTQLFLSDPAGTLPHYPMWDINRGFGP